MHSHRWAVTGGLGCTVLALAFNAGPAAAQTAGPPSGSGVQPTLVAGNPNCEGSGYTFSTKVEPVASGTYTLEEGGNTITLTVKDTSGGPTFDWSSTLPLDVVIVKGGDNANIYRYDPEATGDTALHAPVNPNNGTYYGLSHVEICYDYEVSVGKTAETTFTRTFHWDIEKSVSPASWSLFAGASGTSTYTVALTRTGFTDSDWVVGGTVTVTNDTPFDASVTGISDGMEGIGAVTLDCGVTFPTTLVAGATLQCTYSRELSNGEDRVNTATVTTSGMVGGGEATADVTFGDPTTVVDGEVNVTDTNGTGWGPVSASATWTYTKEFSCSSNPADYTGGTLSYSHPNTAAIVETGQSDDASVGVVCYAPVVTKTAGTELTRTYRWSLDKSADQASLVLSPGQIFTVNYGVKIEVEPVDSDWKASGTITVRNPNPSAAMTVGLTDVMTPDGIGATLDCGGTLTVPAGGTGTCTYQGALPDATERTNTATATLNGIPFTGTAPVTFAQPGITEIDTCITVTDGHMGELGLVCAADAPHTFTYPLDVGPYETCGENEVTNTASFVTDDTGTEGRDTVVLPVTVPCDGGCTLTPGYWKTHSRYGPAPYDETWAQLGEDTVFFLSGQSYYQVLWTAPRGNAYFILAHAYIAARMNLLNGASMPSEVSDALAAAEEVFNTYTPADVAAMKGRGGTQLRAEILGYATMLDDYNNGLTGPGHCSE